jgi:hypothetical protein
MTVWVGSRNPSARQPTSPTRPPPTASTGTGCATHTGTFIGPPSHTLPPLPSNRWRPLVDAQPESLSRPPLATKANPFGLTPDPGCTSTRSMKWRQAHAEPLPVFDTALPSPPVACPDLSAGGTRRSIRAGRVGVVDSATMRWCRASAARSVPHREPSLRPCPRLHRQAIPAFRSGALASS